MYPSTLFFSVFHYQFNKLIKNTLNLFSNLASINKLAFMYEAKSALYENVCKWSFVRYYQFLYEVWNSELSTQNMPRNSKHLHWHLLQD